MKVCRQCLKWGYTREVFATLDALELHILEKHPERLLAQYQGVMRMLTTKLDGRINLRDVLAEAMVGDLEEFPDRTFKAFFPKT